MKKFSKIVHDFNKPPALYGVGVSASDRIHKILGVVYPVKEIT